MYTESLTLASLATVATLMILYGLQLIRATRRTVKERLGDLGSRPLTLEELELSQPFFDRLIRPTVAQISSLMNRRHPEQSQRELRRRLALAGNPNNLEATDFLGLKGLVGMVLGGLCFLLLAAFLPWWQTALVAIVFAGIGYMLPEFWLSTLVGKRKKSILKALPDSLDLLTISVEAGLGFDAALNKVAQKWATPLSEEFARTLAEMRMGKGRRDALKDLAARTDVADMNAVLSSLIQADQLGVSIAKILRVQADQMRVNRRQRAEQQAHQAPVKMTFPLVFLLFPAMLIIIVGPAIVQVVQLFSSGAVR
ncbi:MAG: type II secretion system F family protein [Chloroflexota bacterium]